MDICLDCKNLIEVVGKFKEKEPSFTYRRCKYNIDSMIVTKCSHFKPTTPRKKLLLEGG